MYIDVEGGIRRVRDRHMDEAECSGGRDGMNTRGVKMQQQDERWWR